MAKIAKEKELGTAAGGPRAILPPLVAPNTSEVSFLRPLSGFLHLSIPLKGWKEFFFSIKPAAPNLLFYGKDEAATSREAILMTECESIVAAGMDAERFLIDIVCGKKVYHLAATSEKRRQYWIEGLKTYQFSTH